MERSIAENNTSLSLTEQQQAELSRGRPVPLENGRYFLISREVYERVRETLEVTYSDWSLYEFQDAPDEP